MHFCTPVPLFIMCFQVITGTDGATTEKMDLRPALASIQGQNDLDFSPVSFPHWNWEIFKLLMATEGYPRICGEKTWTL